MRKVLFFMGAALLLASCTTITKTATTEKLPATFYNATVADLDVAPERINYTTTPSKALQRGVGINSVKQAAVNEALQKNGNADLLVEPEFVIVQRKKFFGARKVVQITVSGRPAKYTGFRSLNDSVWCDPVFRSYRAPGKSGSWFSK